MKMLCTYHKKTHDHYEWRSNAHGTFCKDAINDIEDAPLEETFHIGVSKVAARVSRWSHIKSRVTAHDGEILDGKKGRDYQIKYSKKYLGKDMSAPPDFRGAQYQKQLAKTK